MLRVKQTLMISCVECIVYKFEKKELGLSMD